QPTERATVVGVGHIFSPWRRVTTGGGLGVFPASPRRRGLAARLANPLIGPMTLKAKICGVSTTEAVRAALDGKAGWLGFVFFPKSPRSLSPEAAARLAEPARGRAQVVALLVEPSDAQVDEVARVLRPDLIQLHG